MSVINNTLADIANKDDVMTSKIVRAKVVPVQYVNKLAWAIGGFTLSLCLGGWAVSHQMATIVSPLKEPLSMTTEVREKKTVKTTTSISPSPTSKVIENANVSVYIEPSKERVELAPLSTVPTQQEKRSHVTKTSKITSSDEPISITQTTSVEHSRSRGSMAVEQVELTPSQLASNAIERGKKELDSNNLDGAIKAFETAQKYLPSDEITRKKLAALYYGKKNLRKSIELLQHGIRLNEDSQRLRMALSRILIKESQPEAALSPLIYLPSNVDIKYLEMRAAIAQQIKHSAVAFETYQMLVDRQPDNARWWLGLAIQQERKMLYPEAKKSYQEAVSRVGVSKQTQVFIRDRLTLLNSLEESSGAN